MLDFLIQNAEQALLGARRELMKERQYLQMACSRDLDRAREGWEGLERCARAHLSVRTRAAELRRLRRMRSDRSRVVRPYSTRLYAYGHSRH